MKMTLLRLGDILPGCDHIIQEEKEEQILRRARERLHAPPPAGDVSPELDKKIRHSIEAVQLPKPWTLRWKHDDHWIR